MIIKGKPLIPHGRKFQGTVINAKAQQTATVEWYWKRYVPKYERYEQKRTRIHAHNSPDINAVKGDKVLVQECRPISKTKHFVIIQKIGKDTDYLEKEQVMAAAEQRDHKEGKETVKQKKEETKEETQ